MHDCSRLLLYLTVDQESYSEEDERHTEPLSHIEHHILLETYLRFLDELYEETHTETSDEESSDEENGDIGDSEDGENEETEGLTEVVGANDIVNNLANVLSTGLQGAAAEEFAYIATKLNAAIPTQDFFQYAQTYQLVASNAISQGKSLEEALALADAELESFANSVLYAGRELSSGFATGLKGAENLFQKAEQLAQAGRYESGAQLGASLTSIAAITGAVAPDLSSAIVDAIYNASVGGNASQLVALRSLAGINASNTEFLNSLLQNPQQVLGDLFDKLNQYQNMASGAYMEVAEGLSSIFGVSTEALARVDFGQVANAVRASANPSNALEQNMKLLVSGQTTTTAEMQRIYEANKYTVMFFDMEGNIIGHSEEEQEDNVQISFSRD